MPSPSSTPFAATQSQPTYPALCFYPLNDSFVPKHITLQGGQHVKIGRQTNAKTVPGERNGYFDSKVLSRQHAEVWEENNKIYLKDVKSSNGTFINGERLSVEGVESDPFELKTDDLVEFGIDIVAEDNKTIIHHKVAAKVVCILNADDAANATRDAYNFQQHAQNTSTSINNGQRRPSIQPQTNSMSGINGINGLGGLGGGGLTKPGRSGLTFEHLMTRLKEEIQKGRETNSELNAVVGSMTDIGEVIGGGQPANLPPFPQHLPPVRPASSQPQAAQQAEGVVSSAALHTLQTQLAETQASLSTHVEKFRTLETLLSEQEGIKREVGALRALLEDRERGRNIARNEVRSDSEDEDDDDDARSVHTIVPHELESVPEEDEADLEMEESDEERRVRRAELGRPRTPEPSSMGMREDDEEHTSDQEQDSPEGTEGPVQLLPSPPPAVPDEITHRLSILSDQLESALELSRSLQVQHTTAQQTIEALESKVSSLESLVRATEAAKATEDAKIAEREAHLEKERQSSMSALLVEFQKRMEGKWDSMKNELIAERERMDKAKSEIELRIQGVEDGVNSNVTKLELGFASLTTHFANLSANIHGQNKEGRTNGLVTPPSPRSLSADSDRPRKKRSLPRRGRSKSRSASPSTTLVDSSSNGTRPSPAASLNSRSSSPSTGSVAPLTDSEMMSPDTAFPPSNYLPTPASSVLKQKVDDIATGVQKQVNGPNVTNTQMAVGAIVFGLVATAILWRAKE